MILLHIIVFSFLNLPFCISQCFGYLPILNQCLTCSVGYYPSLSRNQSFSPSNCKPRLGGVYLNNIYVSNQSACTNNICNGTIKNPFISLFNALEAANIVADPYNYSEINFYLIGTPHYLLIKDLSVSLRQFFRRVNAKLYVGPLYCDMLKVLYCFNRSLNTIPLVYVKTSEFFIFVANSLIIENVVFDGRDLPLHALSGNSTTTSDCYNLKKICCNDNSLNTGANTKNYGTCATLGRLMNYVYWQQRSLLYGLINMEGFFDDPYMQKPLLFLRNVTFATFYPSTFDKTWISILIFTDIPTEISLENTTFFRGALYFGCLFSYLISNDPIMDAYGINFDPTMLKNQGVWVKMLNTNITKYNDMRVTNGFANDDYFTYRFFPILFVNFFGQGSSGNCSFLIQNLLINLSISIKGNKNSAVCIFQSRNVSIFNYSLTRSLDIMPLNVDTSENITFYNFTIDNANNKHELVWINAANVLIYGFKFTSILFPTQDINKPYLSISIFANSTLKIYGGDFYNITYASINIMNSSLILNNVKFSDILYNSSFLLVSGASLKINQSNVSNFTSLYQNSFIETYFIPESPNLIFIQNTLVNCSVSRDGQFLFSKLNNPSDLFVFKNFSVWNVTVAYFVKCAVATTLIFEVVLVQNCMEAGQFINVGLFTKTLSIQNVNFFDNVFNSAALSIDSDSGNLTINGLYIRNIIVKTNNLIYLSSENLSLDSLVISHISINFSIFSVDLFILTSLNVFISNCQIFLSQNLSMRSFFTISNSFNLVFTDSIFIGGGNPSPSLIVLAVKYSISSKLSNLTINNINCYPNSQKIGEQNGILVFLHSEDLTPVNISNMINISGLTLTNVTQCYSGCIGFININTILLSSFLLNNLQAVKPGGISILCSNYVFLSNFIMKNISGISAGGIYIYNVLNLETNNLNFQLISAQKNGGVYIFEKVTFGRIKNSIFKESMADDGGIFQLISSFVVFSNSVIEGTESKNRGGVAFVNVGSITFDNCVMMFLKADSGGAVYVLNGNNFVLSNCFLMNSTVATDGATLMIKNLGSSFIANVSIYMVKTIKGNGNINIENLNFNYHIITNLTVSETEITLGACLYFNSNDRLNLNDIEVFDNKGILFFITSPIGATIIMKEVLIYRNNEGNAKNLQLFYLKNLDFSLENAEFTRSLARNSFFDVDSAKIFLLNANFSHLADNLTIHPFVIFNFINSNITLEISMLTSNEFDNLSCLCQDVKIPIIFINMVYSKMLIVNCSFLNGFSSDGSSLQIETSDIKIINTKFVCNMGKTAGAIFSLFSEVFLIDCMFSNNFGSKGYNDIFIENYNFLLDIDNLNLTIIKSTFFQNSEGTSIFADKLTELNIENCTFNGKGSPGIEATQTFKIIIIGNEFYGFSSDKGAVLYIHSDLEYSDGQSICLIWNNFTNNVAYVGGVYYIEGDYDLTLTSNIFLKNHAIHISKPKTGIAAVGYFLCNELHPLSISIFSNFFENNRADSFISTIFSYQAPSIFSNNTFINNSDSLNFSSNYFTFPLKVYLSNYSDNIQLPLPIDFLTNMTYIQLMKTNNSSHSNSFILDVVSGQPLNFSLILTNFDGKPLIFDNSAYSKTSIFSNATVSVENGAADSSCGVLFFQDIVFHFTPGTNTTISLDTTVIPSLYIPTFSQEPLEYTLLLTVRSRLCIIGEKYNPIDFSCSQCPEDTFSLFEPMSLYFERNTTVKCEKCPDNSYCYNGSFITPLSGYYRHSNTSRLIVECIVPDACLGYQGNLTSDEKIHGVCEIHQYGPLCYICEFGYARMSSKKLCDVCEGNTWTYIRIVLAVIAIFLYIYVQVQLTFKANQTTYMGILLKLLMNHLQQISMISLINLGWTPDFKMLFNFQQYFSFISEDFISLDCFVQDLPFNLLAKKVIFSNVLPILLSVIAFVIWIFSWSYQLVLEKPPLKNYLLNRTKVTSLIVTYILFPEILRKCFSLLNCIKVDDDTNEETLLLSPELLCWRSVHIDYLLCGSVPGLIVWGLITPVFLTYLLLRFRSNIKENIEIMQRKFILFNSLKKLSQVVKGSDNEFENSLKKQQFVKPEVAIFHRIKPVLNALTSQKALPNEKENKTKKRISKLQFKNKKTMLAERLSITNLNVRKEIKDPEVKQYNIPALYAGSIYIKKGVEISEQDPDLKVKLEHEITINLDGLNQRELQLQQEFGSLLKFLYKGYAPEFYYWEIVMYTKKFLLIFIGFFSEFFPSTTKATILLIILTYFLFIQTRKKPFETDFLNNVEYFSLIVTFVTSNIGIMLFTKDLNQYGQYFLIIVIIFNVGFFGLWLFYFSEYVILRNEFGLLDRINGVFNFFKKIQGISVKNNGNIKNLCKNVVFCIISAGIKICQRRKGLERKKGKMKVGLNKKKECS